MSNKKPRLALCCVLLMTICSVISLGFSERVSAIPGDAYEPDDTYDLATEILSGSPQNHNINESGTDVDWVFFVLYQESSIVLETSGSSGDTLLYLYNTSGVPTTYITYNDDSGPGLFSRISRTNLPPDTYYAKVQEYGMNSEISSYDITLTILHDDIYEPDDTYTQASEIFSGLNQTHNINDGGADVDWVFFTLSLTSNVTIATSGQSGDTQMYLYNSTGVPSSYIAYNDDGGVGAFSRIFRSDLPPDTYYVRVREYGSNSEIPSYNISLIV